MQEIWLEVEVSIKVTESKNLKYALKLSLWWLSLWLTIKGRLCRFDIHMTIRSANVYYLQYLIYLDSFKIAMLERSALDKPTK